jgi:hypothetical protein
MFEERKNHPDGKSGGSGGNVANISISQNNASASTNKDSKPVIDNNQKS